MPEACKCGAPLRWRITCVRCEGEYQMLLNRWKRMYYGMCVLAVSALAACVTLVMEAR